MIKHDGAVFYLASTSLAMTRVAIQHSVDRRQFPESDVLTASEKIGIRPQLKVLLDSTKDLGLDLAEISISGLLYDVEEPSEPLTVGKMLQAMQEIEGRIRDGLLSVHLLALSRDEASLFEPKAALFGEDFAQKFRTEGAFELDEAAKCLALARPTAAVFHLMRLMEIGVRAVARCLEIPDPLKPGNRNWGYILGQIWSSGITTKWPTVNDRLHGEGQLFEAMYASFDAAKNPWRNSTMHVEKKYTDDEARQIFAAVKGLMTVIASRMDENGDPKA